MTKTCGECKHHKEKCHCEKFGCYAGESDFCDEFEPAKKQITTNGDKIRQGGNKRLITFATEWSCFHCLYRNAITSRCEKPEGKDCFDGIEAWLNTPAESEVEDEKSILAIEEIEHPYANLSVMLEDKRKKAEQMRQTVFARITASPEVLAENLTYWQYDPNQDRCGWTNNIIGELYKKHHEAIAATVAKLKEVAE